jgi:hypothetical protein
MEMKRQMIKIFVSGTALVIAFLIISGCRRGGDAEPAVLVAADPRVELMSLIFRLAGNPEYNQGRIASYNQAVEKYFSAFKDHEAVKLATRLRETQGISYDAVMSLAVHIIDADSLKEKIPFDPQPESLERRWTPQSAREFLQAARRFVKDSDFMSFVRSQAGLYNLAASRMQAVMDQHGVVDWFNTFFGARAGARFDLLLGLLNGPASYGARIRLSDRDEILYCILGVEGIDEEGNPEFKSNDLPTVVHEFAHSFCNPLVYEHAPELESPAKQIFALVEEGMSQMAYGTWQTMMRESLVRASVARYLLAKSGEGAARMQIESDKKRQFFWMAELSNLLGEYEKDRPAYPTLDDFFPRIAEFFRDYVPRAADDVKAFEDARQARLEKIKASSPRIVNMVPASGARDVDPELKAIIVTFDRPMKDKQWAVIQLSDKFPEMAGDASYNQDRKVFAIPVKLRPDTEYELGLNADGFLVFSSEAGDVLYPVVIRFKTRPK